MGLRFTPKTHFLFQSDAEQRTAQRCVIFILAHPLVTSVCVVSAKAPLSRGPHGTCREALVAQTLSGSPGACVS